MTSINYTEAAPGRNSLPARPNTDDDHDRRQFTPGGWLVHTRTGWGASLSNLVATLAGIGVAVEG